MDAIEPSRCKYLSLTRSWKRNATLPDQRTMKLTYIKQASEPNGDAGDQYTGPDRFGRVAGQRWPQGEMELVLASPWRADINR